MAKPTKTKPNLHDLPPVARNLNALIASEDSNVNAWAAKYGLVQSTVNRIVNGADASVSKLEEIAQAMRDKGRPIEAWQLLAPNLGEGLFEMHVTDDGKPRIFPFRAPVDKAPTSGLRPQLTWDEKNNPKRRKGDRAKGGA